MPLTGKVAGYRQQPQQFWQQQQQSYDPNLAIYGYMDDQKISMIQQWVECQSNQRQHVHQQQHQKAMAMAHHSKNQVEPEPFAWLNEGQEAIVDEGCKVLTQFKTVESDDSEKDDQGVFGSNPHVDKILADVHVQPESTAVISHMITPPLSPNIIVPEDMEIIEKVLDHEESVTDTDQGIQSVLVSEASIDDPKVTKLVEEESLKKPEESTNYIRTIDELYTHCEQLVETLSQASEELKQNQSSAESHQSSEENLNVTVSSLDANKLHFANRPSPNCTVFSGKVH